MNGEWLKICGSDFVHCDLGYIFIRCPQSQSVRRTVFMLISEVPNFYPEALRNFLSGLFLKTIKDVMYTICAVLVVYFCLFFLHSPGALNTRYVELELWPVLDN